MMTGDPSASLQPPSCINHPHTPAANRCARGGLAGSPRTLPDARLALGLAILSLVLFWVLCLSWAPAIVAIALAVTVLSRTNKERDLPGRPMAIAALVTALAAIAGSIIFVA